MVGDDVADGGRLPINVGSGCEFVCDQAGSKGVVCCMGKKGKPTVHKSTNRNSSRMDRSGSCFCRWPDEGGGFVAETSPQLFHGKTHTIKLLPFSMLQTVSHYQGVLHLLPLLLRSTMENNVKLPTRAISHWQWIPAALCC